jgi:hypothetical protein
MAVRVGFGLKNCSTHQLSITYGEKNRTDSRSKCSLTASLSVPQPLHSVSAEVAVDVSFSTADHDGWQVHHRKQDERDSCSKQQNRLSDGSPLEAGRRIPRRTTALVSPQLYRPVPVLSALDEMVF